MRLKETFDPDAVAHARGLLESLEPPLASLPTDEELPEEHRLAIDDWAQEAGEEAWTHALLAAAPDRRGLGEKAAELLELPVG